MKVRFRNKLESFVRCEEQLWPDCGGPSNTFLPPHASRRQSHPDLFLLGFRPRLTEARRAGGSGVREARGWGRAGGVFEHRLAWPDWARCGEGSQEQAL